jgi:CheY-like chemotaxis protein/HPt (histidine-containing phosphotransfer) domain-containing protein
MKLTKRRRVSDRVPSVARPSNARCAVSIHPLDGVRVLVVDDCEVTQEIARRVLERQGATVMLAGDGVAAITHLRASPGAVDIILVDLQMPRLDGLETTRRIRADPGLAGLPVIAVTGASRRPKRTVAYAAGMNDFIVKPYEPSALTACILRHLSRASSDVTPSVGAAPIGPQTQGNAWPVIDGVDAVVARQKWGDDADVYLSMLERLIDEFDRQVLPAIASKSRDFSGLASALHKLCGGACVLGANAIYRIASALERACESGARDGIPALAAALATEVDCLRKSLSCEAQAWSDRRDGSRSPRDEALRNRQLAELIDLLRAGSPMAAPRFSVLSSFLRRLLGHDQHQRILDHIYDSRFDEALVLLAALHATR